MSNTIKQLIKELKDIEGIDNELEYYKNQYYLKYSQDGEKLAEVLQCETFITSLKLPEAVYNEFFNPSLLNEEEKGAYYLWWMDFVAEYDTHFFPEYKRKIDELRNLKSPGKLLSKELEKIEAFEESVDRLYETGYISFEKPLLPGKYFEEQNYLKLSHDYYRIHPSRELAHHLKDIADVKAKYILTKDYILNQSGIGDLKQDQKKIPRFSNYVNSENSISIVEKLKKVYSNSKPKTIAFMVVALKGLGIVFQDVFSNKSKLHRALKNDFGDIGTKQSFEEILVNFEIDPPEKYSVELREYKDQIQKLLPNL